jgi:hypothetical protein
MEVAGQWRSNRCLVVAQLAPQLSVLAWVMAHGLPPGLYLWREMVVDLATGLMSFIKRCLVVVVVGLQIILL